MANLTKKKRFNGKSFCFQTYTHLIKEQSSVRLLRSNLIIIKVCTELMNSFNPTNFLQNSKQVMEGPFHFRGRVENYTWCKLLVTFCTQSDSFRNKFPVPIFVISIHIDRIPESLLKIYPNEINYHSLNCQSPQLMCERRCM